MRTASENGSCPVIGGGDPPRPHFERPRVELNLQFTYNSTLSNDSTVVLNSKSGNFLGEKCNGKASFLCSLNY